MARAVALLPRADGGLSTINDPSDEDTGYCGEIRLPWSGLGLPAERRRADDSYDLAGLELPILAAALHGDSGSVVSLFGRAAAADVSLFGPSLAALSAGEVERKFIPFQKSTANRTE